MSTPESDLQNDLLRSIATSLKGIQSSLEHLTGAVEGVGESIETAHEPEGDLGVHLVGALKDLTSALHKRAQQERTFPPQQQQRPQQPVQQQNRRDDRQQRPEHRGNPEQRPLPDRPPQLPHHHEQQRQHEESRQEHDSPSEESAEAPQEEVLVSKTHEPQPPFISSKSPATEAPRRPRPPIRSDGVKRRRGGRGGKGPAKQTPTSSPAE